MKGEPGTPGQNGENGQPGADGFSPTVSIAPNEENDGTIITITDVNGKKSVEVLNGNDGPPGFDGKDATINGQNAIELVQGENVTITQEGSNVTISANFDGVSPAGSNIPTGGIIMWSGETVPDGWALCDGENGTPDLRGRFLLGTSDTHPIGETGGEEEVTLTIEQIPPHNHSYTNVYTSGGYASGITWVGTGKTQQTISVSNTGGGKPHNNMPPYYVLAFIMKL